MGRGICGQGGCQRILSPMDECSLVGRESTPLTLPSPKGRGFCAGEFAVQAGVNGFCHGCRLAGRVSTREGGGSMARGAQRADRERRVMASHDLTLRHRATPNACGRQRSNFAQCRRVSASGGMDFSAPL